jgi:hypothetical protein
MRRLIEQPVEAPNCAGKLQRMPQTMHDLDAPGIISFRQHAREIYGFFYRRSVMAWHVLRPHKIALPQELNSTTPEPLKTKRDAQTKLNGYPIFFRQQLVHGFVRSRQKN